MVLEPSGVVNTLTSSLSKELATLAIACECLLWSVLQRACCNVLEHVCLRVCVCVCV